MVNENDIIKLLQANYIQLRQQQAQLVKLTEAVESLTYNAGKYSQILPFGILNITTSQLVNAYMRGLSMEQLVALANGKYTAEQIKAKIAKAMGGNM